MCRVCGKIGRISTLCRRDPTKKTPNFKSRKKSSKTNMVTEDLWVAIISHVMENGQEQSIAFTSRMLSKNEQNYSQIKKEALALIFGVKKFHLYLSRETFTLMTDHKLLIWPNQA